MRRRTTLAAVLGALALALAPRPASACSCVPPRLQRVSLPADGATDFPTDGVIRVFLTGGFPEPLRLAMASEHRLRDASGALVPLDARVVGTRLDLRPRAPLAPGARYVLEGVFAYDASGVRVSDTERWVDALRGGGAAGLRGAWFPVAAFETASGPAPRRRTAPQITAARLHFAMGGGDCGPGVGLTAELQLPPLVASTDVLELRVEGVGVVETIPARDAPRVYASDTLCNPDPVTLPARTAVRAEVAILDASGVELGTSGWSRARGVPRFALDARWHGHRRTATPTADQQAAVQRWTSIPIVAASGASDPGPAGCPHGLEITRVRETAPSGGPWIYEALSSLTSDGRRAWNVLGEPTGGARVHRLDAGAAATPGVTLAGSPASGASGADGPYFVTRVYASGGGSPQTTLHALANDGSARWQAPIQGDGDYFQLAAGSGRVLASWNQGGAALNARVVWAVFDAATGAPVGSTHASAHAVHTNGGLASAFVNDRFFLAWPAGRSRPTVSLAVLSRDGAELSARDLGVAGHGPMDLAAAGSRVALVTESDRQIAWHLLDESGALLRGPVVVSAGVGQDNRKPRVAWNGSVFAVAWETHPSARTYVTVVDESGRVAPALALEPGVHTSTVGVAAIGRELLLAYTRDPYESARVVTAALRCRASAPAGAPQRITVAPAP